MHEAQHYSQLTRYFVHTGSVILKCPVTLAVCLMNGNYITTEQVTHTTIHVDSGAGVAVAAQDIHNGNLADNTIRTPELAGG